MADADDANREEAPEAESGAKKSLVGRLLPWAIITVVVAVCAGAGFGLGRLFAGSPVSETTESESGPDESTQADDLNADDSATDSKEVWYYDLEPPVIANLNEPSVTRYVSASLTLEISSALKEKDGAALIDEKKPILRNWLYVYLSGLSLEDVRGDKNLKSIQSQILTAFNEQLFPDSKPQIKQVLIRQFPVQ